MVKKINRQFVVPSFVFLVGALMGSGCVFDSSETSSVSETPVVAEAPETVVSAKSTGSGKSDKGSTSGKNGSKGGKGDKSDKGGKDGKDGWDRDDSDGKSGGKVGKGTHPGKGYGGYGFNTNESKHSQGKSGYGQSKYGSSAFAGYTKAAKTKGAAYGKALSNEVGWSGVKSWGGYLNGWQQHLRETKPVYSGLKRTEFEERKASWEAEEKEYQKELAAFTLSKKLLTGVYRKTAEEDAFNDALRRAGIPEHRVMDVRPYQMDDLGWLSWRVTYTDRIPTSAELDRLDQLQRANAGSTLRATLGTVGLTIGTMASGGLSSTALGRAAQALGLVNNGLGWRAQAASSRAVAEQFNRMYTLRERVITRPTYNGGPR